MRHAIWLLLCLGGLVWCGTRVEIGGAAGAQSDGRTPSSDTLASPWRRAKDGWQRVDCWPGGEALSQSASPSGFFAFSRTPLPHPLIVALLLLLASLWILLAFDVTARFRI